MGCARAFLVFGKMKQFPKMRFVMSCTEYCQFHVYICKSIGGKIMSLFCARFCKMSQNAKAGIIMDSVFMSVHVSRCDEVIRLLSAWSNEIDSICCILNVASLRCDAFVGVSTADHDEYVLIELNTRRCHDSDMRVAKVCPLDKEVFTATIINTRRLSVAHVTPLNPQKLAQMQRLAAINKKKIQSLKKNWMCI